MADEFETSIPLHALEKLAHLGSELGFDPLASVESEQFFTELVAEFHGTSAEFDDWLRDRLATKFRLLGEPPNWIQNPDWQFGPNGPLVFAGQIDIPAVSGTFHDDASFYTFWEPETGRAVTILQVA